MNLKNYTSSVPVSRTIANIEELLAQAGANAISKDYVDTKLVAITFNIQKPDHKQIAIRLPADTAAVYQVMAKAMKRPRPGTVERIREQAERTAWKLMQDWVEVQLSLIAMQQAEFIQVFLPYVWDGKQTIYAMLKANGFKQLPEPKTQTIEIES